MGSAEQLPHETPSASGSPCDQMISKEEELLVWRTLTEILNLYRVPMILFYHENRSIPGEGSALGSGPLEPPRSGCRLAAPVWQAGSRHKAA